MSANRCKKCEKNFKTLTKEDLCAFCHFDTYREWAKEFTDDTKKMK